MSKHLFLEGEIQLGKSTLIRECIRPYINQLGGFSSQRIRDEKGKVWGYRLTAATNLQVDTIYCPGASGVFQYRRSSGGMKKDLSVFETKGVELLEDAKKHSLILLDEIGGSELMVPAFCDKLYEILSGDIPCIGVLKLSDRARSMSQAAGYPGEVAEANEKLRRDLKEKYDAKIIRYEQSARDAIEKEINAFLMKRMR